MQRALSSLRQRDAAHVSLQKPTSFAIERDISNLRRRFLDLAQGRSASTDVALPPSDGHPHQSGTMPTVQHEILPQCVSLRKLISLRHDTVADVDGFEHLRMTGPTEELGVPLAYLDRRHPGTFDLSSAAYLESIADPDDSTKGPVLQQHDAPARVQTVQNDSR